ncbi:hypothetical protein EES45_16545 [Streptomyces sp. ADI97-07]|uniref:DUF6303 family protein n=1 Tax=Streptomyces sp. ADI97-07 TaxID=1522762 RepID=UPI000F55527E|nr:DUF6303 family protein [Streptomyces sp. ADI97-07]RPK78871.1 hypothetical protein EES45_16545 [Streptomyces sp. ADI97-07]
MMLPQARMATGASGTWVLYVLTAAPFLEWPVYDSGRTAPMPTRDERAQALAALGYTIEDGAEWEWNATRHSPAAAHLWAAIAIRPITAAVIGGGEA